MAAVPGIPIAADTLLAALEAVAVQAAAAALLVGVVTNTAVCAYFVHCMFDQLYGAAAPSSTTMIIVNKPTPTLTAAPATIMTGSHTGSLLPVPSISASSTGAQCMLCVIEQWFNLFPAYWCD